MGSVYQVNLLLAPDRHYRACLLCLLWFTQPLAIAICVSRREPYHKAMHIAAVHHSHLYHHGRPGPGEERVHV